MTYKIELEATLERMLGNEYYSIEELTNLLGLKDRQACKAFRRVKQYSEGVKREDIIFRSMVGWDTALQTLLIFMAVDYFSGLVVAGVFKKPNKTESGD